MHEGQGPGTKGMFGTVGGHAQRRYITKIVVQYLQRLHISTFTRKTDDLNRLNLFECMGGAVPILAPKHTHYNNIIIPLALMTCVCAQATVARIDRNTQ